MGPLKYVLPTITGHYNPAGRNTVNFSDDLYHYKTRYEMWRNTALSNSVKNSISDSRQRIWSLSTVDGVLMAPYFISGLQYKYNVNNNIF